MLLPISELIGYGLFITNSPIPWITWGIIVTLAITYSINNAAKEVLYTAGPRSFKYQAKGIIETFFFRTGDVSGALSIILFTHVFAMPGYEIFVLLGIVFLFRVWIINLICSRFNKGQIVANKDSLNQETTTDNTTLE
jgi:ATP/ADP translocase